MADNILKPLIFDMGDEYWDTWISNEGLPRFRSRQISGHINQGILSADEMTTLPLSLRKKLEEEFDFSIPVQETKRVSSQDGTTKYYFRLRDGNGVESVFMNYKTGYSVCLSTQSGCRMGCRFCASTGIGFGRNLSAGELLLQIRLIERDKGVRISHVVLMGIGEPLENYTEVVKFIRAANNPEGLNISMRHISLSTCGLVPEIERLADEAMPITLAVSLHAPEQKLRESMMPIAKKYTLDMLVDAIKTYIDKTGRRVTFEYAMFADVNDTPQAAHQLCNLVRGMLCHVNLIPANEFPGGFYKRSSAENIKRFKNILDKNGIPCTVRRELGTDILAACGQLRRQRENQA